MRCRYLLVDNDDTLMDFQLAEQKALAETLMIHGLPCNSSVQETYHQINRSEWEALERGETTRERLKISRYARLLRALGRDDGPAADMAATYEKQLGTHADLLPGAMEFLRRVHPRVKIALVSNGFSVIQRGRLSRSPITQELDAVIISEECGCNKPAPGIIDAALKALGCEDRREAVMLGDSASSDIAAAANSGIRSIHFRPDGRFSDQAEWHVTTLEQAAEILEGNGVTPAEQQVIDAAQDYIRDLFAGESSGHDVQHSLRVWRTARTLCDREGADSFICELAALLHDADDAKLFDTAGTLAHARSFMASQGVSDVQSEQICAVIRTVGFKGGHNAPPDSPEGRIVQDADRLDAIGAIGIARAFAYGGAHGRAIHIPGEGPASFESAEAYAAAKGTSVNHFYEKLLLLRDRMNTSAARAMAEERHRYMEGFLEQLYAEWDGER